MKKYINREISWLRFNERVNEISFDSEVPILERLNFISIAASNLDEFFY
jgi:polyphosphate kinase